MSEALQSNIEYFKGELLSKKTNSSFFTSLEKFLKDNKGIESELYIQFINDLLILLEDKEYEYEEINNVLSFKQQKDKLSLLLQKEDFNISDLESFDVYFTSKNINYYVNADVKSLRQIEDKLYRKLLSKSFWQKFFEEKLNNNERINISLGVFLAIDFYRKNKHPAQIITFYPRNNLGNYNTENGNINVDLEYFFDYVNNKLRLENQKNDVIMFNIELMRLIYHECIHFKMLYKNDKYYYESELSDLAADYNVDSIYNSFYLEFCANSESCLLSKEFLQSLPNYKSDYPVYLLDNMYKDIMDHYYFTLNGVRTINPHEYIYEKLEKIIESDENNSKEYNNVTLQKLRINKNQQELNNSVFDDYVLTTEEIKKILLVIMLEYKNSNIISRFNQDVIKDILTMSIPDVIKKYQKKEFKKSLQELYIIFNSKRNYSTKVINELIMALPIGYPFLDKIEALSNKESLALTK